MAHRLWVIGWSDKWDEMTGRMKWRKGWSSIWDEMTCEMKCLLRWSVLGMKCHSGRSALGDVVAYWMKCHLGCSAFFPSGWSDMKKWSALGWSTGEPEIWPWKYFKRDTRPVKYLTLVVNMLIVKRVVDLVGKTGKCMHSVWVMKAYYGQS